MATHRMTGTSWPGDRKSRYLLVVDGDASSRYYISMFLQRLNYQIYAVATASEAVELAAVAVPSLIITTSGPGERGVPGPASQLQEHPSTADVPFIVLTRQEDQFVDRRSLEELGVGVSLAPPILPEVLYRTVQVAMETTPRTSIRVRTRLLATVNTTKYQHLESAFITELSEWGMFLRTGTPVAEQTRLSLQFDLNGRIISVEAIVLHSTRGSGVSDRDPGMGLQFVRIMPEDQEALRQFIRTEVMQGITPLNA
jgi:CheY-like chemotaxis protein